MPGRLCGGEAAVAGVTNARRCPRNRGRDEARAGWGAELAPRPGPAWTSTAAPGRAGLFRGWIPQAGGCASAAAPDMVSHPT